jgi:hypothetical protein
MGRKLVLVAILGLTVSGVCMGAAAAIGGSDFHDGLDIASYFDRAQRCKVIPGATARQRTLDWDGSDHVGLSLRGHAHYRPGTDDKVYVTGDPQVLAHLEIDEGDIQMNCRGWSNRTKDLEITLPGRIFKRFEIAGTGKLSLDALDQPELKVEMAGVAKVEANGKVDRVEIEMAGIGHADFSRVTGREARVEMAGIGKADIAPTEEADIEMAGAGEVRLHSRPRRVDTEIAGPGRVRNLAN